MDRAGAASYKEFGTTGCSFPGVWSTRSARPAPSALFASFADKSSSTAKDTNSRERSEAQSTRLGIIDKQQFNSMESFLVDWRKNWRRYVSLFLISVLITAGLLGVAFSLLPKDSRAEYQTEVTPTDH
jgi:uncharacterized protein YcbK (DUF882 family)